MIKNIRMLLILLLNIPYFNADPSPEHTKNTDLIIFSFNRPMQLYAVLESTQKYFSNLNKTHVLYRISNHEYETAYQELMQYFPLVRFVKQGDNPRSDFKPLLLQCFFDSPAEYIMFAVDDDIVTDYVDIAQCTDALERHNAYAFYLRLGTNIIKTYKEDIRIPLPPVMELEKNILKFPFNTSCHFWNYPHNVDMTIFKKSKIEHFLQHAPYSSPNTLESVWSGTADLSNFGLCFTNSKKFTLPLNMVQQDWYTPNENSFEIETLFMKWKEGFIIDINQFFRINNNCPFMGYEPIFISRNQSRD